MDPILGRNGLSILDIDTDVDGRTTLILNQPIVVTLVYCAKGACVQETVTRIGVHMSSGTLRFCYIKEGFWSPIMAGEARGLAIQLGDQLADLGLLGEKP